MPDPFPLPSFHSYMADITGVQRRTIFFRVALGSDCAYYAEIVGKKDNFRTVKILSSDFPIKIDDLEISAMIPAEELVHLEAGTLVKAVAVGAFNEERILILSTKPEQYSSKFKHQGMKMGVIDYKDLPAHYKLEQECPRKPLYEHIEKYAHLNTEDCEKILEYLNIDPKRMYFAHDKLKPEEMGDVIVQQQKEKRSYDHLQMGLKLYRKKLLPDAEVEFKRAISFDSKNSNAFASLGSLYRNQRRYKEAIKCFETALDLDEENEEIKELLTKTIKYYLNKDKNDEFDEKLIQSIRLYNLQGDEKNDFVLKYYLEAKLSLFIGPPWLENFNEWNEKQDGKNMSHVKLVNDNECSDLIKSVENVLTFNKQEQRKSVKKTKGLVDYDCGSDTSSFKSSGSSVKQPDVCGRHEKQKKKSNHCRDPKQLAASSKSVPPNETAKTYGKKHKW